MSRGPDFDDLLDGQELTPGERERLRRAHDLLLQAGPPAELPPALAEPPSHRATVTFLPRRRRIAAILIAASLLLLAFGSGYLVSERGQASPKVAYSVQMRGTSAEPTARASLLVLDNDEAGNWPMLLKVTGLDELPRGGYYDLYLTKGGKLGPECGTFLVRGHTTTVRLSVAYRLHDFDGWIVTRHVPGQKPPGPTLLTT